MKKIMVFLYSIECSITLTETDHHRVTVTYTVMHVSVKIKFLRIVEYLHSVHDDRYQWVL